MASSWSGQNENIFLSIKKSMGYLPVIFKNDLDNYNTLRIFMQD